MSFRTDRNNNPTAFTTDLAKQAGLVYGVDYEAGEPFPPPSKLVTAKILGNPIDVTLKLIDAIGFYTKDGNQRWVYVGIPTSAWKRLDQIGRLNVLSFMYAHEGGTELHSLFE